MLYTEHVSKRTVDTVLGILPDLKQSCLSVPSIRHAYQISLFFASFFIIYSALIEIFSIVEKQ